MTNKLIKCALLAILLAFASSGAKATMISHLTDNGDTTLDTTTNLEWLDLTSTLGLSAQEFLNGDGGWLALGWDIATVDQVRDLLDINRGGHLFDPFPNDTGSVFPPFDQLAAVNNALLLFGETFSGANEFGEAWALDVDFDSTFEVCQPFYQVQSNIGSRVGFFCAGASWTQDSSVLGVWAFREVNGEPPPPPPNGVPAPSTLLLLGIGLAGFGFARRKRA